MERSSFSIVLHENIFRVLLTLLAALMIVGVFSPAEAQIWEDFTVRYSGNGADSGKIAQQKYPSGTNEITLKMNEASEDGRDEPFVKEGCSFLGWSLAPEAGSVITPILEPGSVWEPKDVPVTWREDKNGFVFYARWDCPNASDQLLIAPAAQSEAVEAVPTSAAPALLLAPAGRSSAKTVDPAAGENSGASGRMIPLKFTTDIDDLPVLPSTGITAGAARLLAQKPASVDYAPLSMELQIPTLGITSDIVMVQFDGESYPVEWLGMNAGLLEGTNLPGTGFSVLAAHNTLDAETYGPFALIASVNVGDHIFIRRSDNKLLIFEIYANEKISEYDYEALYKQGFYYDNTVTLMTCEDERAEGGYASRRIVSAKLVG